jgi:L-threonylcarbamoyladenylate synthase
MKILEEILALELTLGITHKWAKKEIPPWILEGSPYVAFRCLKTEEIKWIIENEKDPITTTSLNRSGEGPVKTFQDAVLFQKSNKVEAELINFHPCPLSGHPSTLLFFDDEKKYVVKRTGENIGKIEQRIRFLAT